MNIGIITAEVPYPDNSGGRKYTWERIKSLRNLGNNIYLYSIKDEEVYYSDEKELNRYCSKVRFYERRKGKLSALLNSYRPYSAFSRYSKEMKKQIKSDIHNEKIDVLIVDIPQLMYNIPLKSSVPIILTQHNIEYKTFINIGKKSNNLIKKMAFIFEGYKLKRFEVNWYKKDIISLFTFISKEDKEFFEKKYNRRTILIPMGVDYLEDNIEKSTTSNKVVFCGKMSYYPNEEAVMWFAKSILPKIKDSLIDVKFYIVGKEPSKEVLDLKSDSIVVTGMVDDVNKFVDMADIVVIPLLSGGGVKIKLLEALSRRKLVVTTQKGIEGTEFKDEEHVIVAENDIDFANKCVEVLKNIERYNYLTDNSIEVLGKNYSWKHIGEIYNKSLKKLCEERR
ncbi:glycosyltransferase family 4 protein [Clostridium sp. SHJSY1]|uniref:glycosyltransferase n=1 Tax=Clostridium sp. SHJSY1 TaxID=2942483 RepID=UPI0028745C20|nr:glycosyltransferase [Clostridium sp. SHJSY1]MDS0526655.1 glycosyltransferase family 4 protein [Clostridium sp. SHJSY1]